MNKIIHQSKRTVGSELERVIEPLASYICATEQPYASLKSALAVLFSEVEQTNRTASAHLVTFSGNFSS
jgi:hypothetical protein